MKHYTRRQLAERLKQERRQRRLNQQAVASAIGAAQQNVSAAEKGTEPNYDALLLRMAAHLLGGQWTAEKRFFKQTEMKP